MLVFMERGRLENPEKNPQSKARTNNKLNPHMTPGRNRTRATLVGGTRSHHCAIPASQILKSNESPGSHLVLNGVQAINTITVKSIV